MNLAVVLFLGGAVVIAWIYFWSRQRRELSETIDLDTMLRNVPAAANGDALLVSEEHGRLVFANEPARQLLKVNGGQPHLEQIAQIAEPANNFLQLLVSEGQSSFQLGSRWVEASSHRIPTGNTLRTVIVMRELASNTSNPDVLNMADAMAIINDIGETVNVTLGVEQTLQAILAIVSRSIKFDAGEITLWDEVERKLVQRGWVGDTTYLLSLTEAGGGYAYGEGISGWIAQYRKPVLISMDEDGGITPKLADNPYQSFVGVPIVLGERLIGTMELASARPRAFTSGEMALLQAVAKSVAVTIYNTDVYAQQMKRIDDIATLQESLQLDDAEPSVDKVYAGLTQRIATLLNADMCGILLYDDDREGLVIQLPVHGLPDALARTVYVPLIPESPQHDIWANQPYWVSNDVADEPLVEALGLRPTVDLAAITNTAWMPLQLAGERIGVLAVSNKRSEGGFTPRDIQNLIVLSSQTAIVIENVRLYKREKRMDDELVGLQEITNAIGALSHETEFFGEITERIARLMNIEMVGILMYDADNDRLVSQLPFHGVANVLVEDYVIELPPGSVMRELWEEESYWYSNRVQADTMVFAAGLDEIASRIGVQKTMIAVLQASGRRLGVVQVSNKRSGEDFNDSDARMLMIFATQAAAIIENARLYREAQRSAEQAQGLRRVAELAGNVLTTEETFSPVLAEIASLMGVEKVFINVLDQQKGQMITYPRWVFGAELSEPITQDIYSPGFEDSVAVSQIPYISNDVLGDDLVLPSYRQIADRMGLRTSIMVPLVFGDRTLGELGVANRREKPFMADDLEVMKVIAAQIAAALDRLLLYEATGENLNRRIEELDAISRVSNELTITLDLDRVLTVIREESIYATGADDCTVVIFTSDREDKTPRDFQIERRLGEIGDARGLADVEQEAAERETEPVLITDYEFSTMAPRPSESRSALAVPVMYLETVVGVIHLYHRTPGHFDDRAAAFMMTMAVKASLGYGNAVRYSEQLERSERLRQRVDQLNRIFELGHMFQTNTNQVSILEAIAYSVQQSVGFDTIVMLLLDQNTDILHRVTQAGMPLDAFQASQAYTISMETLDKLLQPEFRISESYFFPVEEVKKWYVPDTKALSTAYEGNRTIEVSGRDIWHDGDLFVVRLQGPSGNLIGLMVLDRPHNNRRPDRGTVEVLEIFANQAASTIENTRLYLGSVQSAEQEARLNEVMEEISSTLDVEEIVRSVAEGALRLVSFDRLTVALGDADDTGFEVFHISVTDGQQLEVQRDQRTSLRKSAMQRTYNDGKEYLYQTGDDDIEQYEDLRQWHANGERVTIILPLITGGEMLGTVAIGSNNDADSEFRDARNLLKRMAQLFATSVQNARLFDQAVNLQVLNESVVESIQQGIIVLDNSGHIISFNTFMRDRFSWGRGAVGQDLFEYQPEIAEVMREQLTGVLGGGEPQEHISQTIADATGQEIIANFYIYPLRFGATIRGAVILVEDMTERSRLEQAIEARANQLAALTDVSTRITSSLERDEVVQLALEEMGWLIPHQAMSLWRRNGSYLVLEGATELPVEEARERNLRFLFVDHETIHQVVDTQRVVAISGEVAVPAELPIHKHAVSWMGVPLVNQGHVVGLIMLTDSLPNMYESKSDQNIAFAFASQVAIALANADLFEQTFDRTNELGILLEAAQATSLTTDLDSIFRTVVELMFSALDMDDCAIMTWDEVDNHLEVQLDRNRQDDKDRTVPVGTRFDVEQYPARRRALRDREVVVISHSDENSPYRDEVEDLVSNGLAARMLVPLVVRESARGLIQLGTQSEEIVTQQKVRLARALGAQVAVAIENARLSAETTSHFEESLIINDLSRAISSTLDLDDMLNVVREQLPGVAGAGEMYLALYDSTTEEITFPLAVRYGESYAIPPRKLGKDEVSFVIRQRRPLNLGADYYSPDELRRSLGIEGNEADARSYLGVPLIAGDEVYGVLAVRDTERTRAFTINEQRILTTVGSQLGAAIQNARLFRQISTFADDLNRQVAERTYELEAERDRIDTLYQITSELARTLDMDRLMPRALGMVAKAVNAQDGVIMQLDPITDQLYSRAVLNPTHLQENPDSDHPYHPAERIARWIILEDEHVRMIDDLHEEEYWEPEAPGAGEWRSALAVLLETNEELLGVMVFLSQEKAAFHESHLRLMVAAANQVASSINNAELYKMIREQAERLGMLLRAEQEEADKNKAILEGIADGVVLADSEGKIILFNSAAERILRVPRTEASGKKLSTITGVYGPSAQSWAQALETRMIDPESSEIGEFIDERVALGDRTVSVHLSPVYTGDRYLGTVSVFRDITREVEAERSKSEFVANVSHEFRTPLTSIKGYNDLLLMGAFGEVGDQQKRMLSTIKDNVTRLAALVEDVLNISQIDSGKERLAVEKVDLNELMQHVIDHIRQRPQHQFKDLSIEFDPMPGLPVIEADPEKLMRAFGNVIDNAFNYTLAGGTISIDIAPDDGEQILHIAISDTGVGIPDEFAERIWRRFERHEDTALSLDVAGTGLGLPIVKELVEMHGGEIWFESEVGVGTTFYIKLPFKQPMSMYGDTMVNPGD